MPFEIQFSDDAVEQLRELPSRDRKTVLDALDKHLMHQPAQKTRNRKAMRPNLLATWELRIGKLRVYYDVETEPEPVVRVQAIGIKLRDRVYINRKEVDL